MKCLKDKLKKNSLKPFAKYILYGVNSLKNSPTEEHFQNNWNLIKAFREAKLVPKEFISNFNKNR